MKFTNSMRPGKVNHNNWATPQWLFDKWNAKYHFVLDVAASKDNAKCPRFLTEEDDALRRDWLEDACPPGSPCTSHAVWCNPPYVNILAWVKKAYTESQNGLTVVMLLPAGTDTEWFHDYVIPKGKVEFIRGRLKFGNAKHSAMSPSIIVVFEPPADFLPR